MSLLTPDASVKPTLPSLGFIGGGNMCSAIVGGLLDKQIYTPEDIHVCDVSQDQLQILSSKYKVGTTTDITTLLERASIIFLSVKPNVVSSLLEEHASNFDQSRHIIISVCAGVLCSTIESFFLKLSPPKRISVLRVMPNTPALVGYSASGLCIGHFTHPTHLTHATTIMSAVGIVKIVPEHSMDAVTGLSGSGPAYVFTMIESLTMGGVLAGLTYHDAKDLALQTVLGACYMVQKTDLHPSVLRDQVTSAGGTTIHGLYALEEGKLKGTIMSAVLNASKRATELSEIAKQPQAKL